MILYGGNQIGKTLVIPVNFLETIWFLGMLRNKCVSLYTNEDEYVFVGNCCTQVLWLK